MNLEGGEVSGGMMHSFSIFHFSFICHLLMFVSPCPPCLRGKCLSAQVHHRDTEDTEKRTNEK
jgi:hypothetical protein